MMGSVGDTAAVTVGAAIDATANGLEKGAREEHMRRARREADGLANGRHPP